MFGKTVRVFLSAGLIAMLAAVCAQAVSSSIWKVQTQGGFETGELTNISINSRGEVTLAPALDLIADTGELYIWCAVEDARGNAYVGTGNNGKVFKTDGDGELLLLADFEEPDVLSLSLDKKGNVYAGTSASGTIYRIAPSGDKSTFFETGENYIWALVSDSEGNLYAGTGSTGKIYKISADGSGDVLYDSPETHIVSLIRGHDNSLYAGGEGSGIVYKISPEGEPFVLYDAAEAEVRCLAIDAEGILYAGAMSGGGPVPGGPPPPMMVQGGPPPAGMGTSVEALQTEEPQQAGPLPPSRMVPPGPPRPGGPGRPRGAGSALYKIARDGVVSEIWRSPDKQLLSLAIDPDGRVILGTGGQGYLYAVDPQQEESATLTQCSEAQVTTILADAGKGMILGCANMGKLYRLGPGYASEGTLESIAYDASTWARWGRVSWEGLVRGNARIALSTRSGNTEKPDTSWSPWADEVETRTEHVTSPNARFVQWRAALSSSKSSVTPLLRTVSVSYLQRNLKPRVRFVSIASRGGRPSAGRNNSGGPPPGQGHAGPPPGQDRGGPPPAASPPGGSDQPIKGPATIKWAASDGNGDQMRYTLYFRGIEEESWKLLEEDLRPTSHSWDSESFPDGSYVVKVVASDDPSNPKDMALTGERTSDPFLVDNTSPEVSNLKVEKIQGNTATLAGISKDAVSPLKEGSYAVDGGELAVFFPVDEIFDSREESFSFQVELPPGDEHILVVRVSDLAGNVGTQKVLVKTGK